VKSECLPFSQIPHTTRLFSDFLCHHAKVRQFYPRSARLSEWMMEEASALKYDPQRREAVAAILERQNQSWGASARVQQNIARLRSGAATVVTGQQVGLFGGPAFSLYKALTSVKLAAQATQAGVDCVPIFWLATEDHDLEEVNQVALPGPDGALQKLTVPVQSVPAAPVGTVVFGPEIQAAVEAAAGWLGDSEVTALLRAAYRPGETFGSAFARLFAQLFADWGVILLDASAPELHRIAAPIYGAAIERAAALDEALLARGKELEAAGYHQQVKVTSSSTLLFTRRNGARIVVHRRPDGNGNEEFLIEDERVSQNDLLNRIAAAPQNFSPNVLLRPVVQDYLLPTLAYTGGSAEVAYFSQAAVVYEALLGHVTPVIPRFSSTLVENKPNALLERYGLTFLQVVDGEAALREKMAAATLPTELQSAFEGAEASLEKSFHAIRSNLAQLDKTLVDAANNAESKMRHQIESLRARAARAELRHAEVLSRHAELLSNALYPNKALQEREIAGISFLARHGLPLLEQLYSALQTECLDHQVISLE